MTVKRPFQARKRSRQHETSGDRLIGTAHVSRVAKLMALAIRFDQLIREGVIADRAELARLGRVTRARLTQIMNLLNLAPEIQQDLLEIQPIDHRRVRVTERELRPVAVEPDWRRQRRLWSELVSPIA